MQILLNRSEIDALLEISLNSVSDLEVRTTLYHLQLLVDSDTGQVEVAGEMVDILRSYILGFPNCPLSKRILAVFSRVLGEGLDYGFFEEN